MQTWSAWPKRALLSYISDATFKFRDLCLPFITALRNIWIISSVSFSNPSGQLLIYAGIYFFIMQRYGYWLYWYWKPIARSISRSCLQQFVLSMCAIYLQNHPRIAKDCCMQKLWWCELQWSSRSFTRACCQSVHAPPPKCTYGGTYQLAICTSCIKLIDSVSASRASLAFDMILWLHVLVCSELRQHFFFMSLALVASVCPIRSLVVSLTIEI